MLTKAPWKKPYLLIVTNLYCNHRCSYCIQQESSLDVRLNPKRIDVPQVLSFLERNRIDRSVKVMGGEATLHPDWEPLMDGLLRLYRRVVVTTNVNGKWYKDFDDALKKMKAWGEHVRWNTTFHPAWMEADLYIERIRAMRAAGLDVDQVTATDTRELEPLVARKLYEADIGWSIQPFTGRSPDGRLLPESWDDVNRDYPQLWDVSKYIDNHDEYLAECEDANVSDDFLRPQWVDCTSSRFLIGPDGNVYPCHRHLYAEDPQYACGNIADVEMKRFRHKWSSFLCEWTLPCHTKCNPCDFQNVKIRPTGRPVAAAARAESGAASGPASGTADATSDPAQA